LPPGRIAAAKILRILIQRADATVGSFLLSVFARDCRYPAPSLRAASLPSRTRRASTCSAHTEIKQALTSEALVERAERVCCMSRRPKQHVSSHCRVNWRASRTLSEHTEIVRH